MNLVGKIFVVAILVMSVLFMAFTIVVYATHQNWREVVLNEQATPAKPLGLAAQLRNDLKINKDLNDQAEKLKQQYDAEKAAKTQAVAKLENELAAATAELKALDAKQAELDAAKREAETGKDGVSATQTKITEDRKELESQRKSAAEAQKDRDAHFQEVVRLTEELNQAVNEKDLLKKRTDELTKDLAKAKRM